MDRLEAQIRQLEKLRNEINALAMRPRSALLDRQINQKQAEYDRLNAKYIAEQQKQSQRETEVAQETTVETGREEWQSTMNNFNEAAQGEGAIPLVGMEPQGQGWKSPSAEHESYEMLPEGTENPVPLQEMPRHGPQQTYGVEAAESEIGASSGSFETQGDRVEGLLEDIVDELRDLNDKSDHDREHGGAGGGTGRDAKGRFTGAGGDGASADPMKEFMTFGHSLGYFSPTVGNIFNHVQAGMNVASSFNRFIDSMMGGEQEEMEEPQGYIPLAREEREGQMSGRWNESGQVGSEVGAMAWEKDAWREEEQVAERFELTETGEADGASNRPFVDAVNKFAEIVGKIGGAPDSGQKPGTSQPSERPDEADAGRSTGSTAGSVPVGAYEFNAETATLKNIIMAAAGRAFGV
jgi:hypothetical protein